MKPKLTLSYEGWGEGKTIYSYKPTYQAKLAELMGEYRYRLDTNFAKIDRIEHEGLEKFKSSVLDKVVLGHTIREWANVIKDDNGLQTLLDIEPSN